MSQETQQQELEVKKTMLELGKILESMLPFHWGYILMMFPFGHDGRLNYVSNADRPDVVRAMYEFIEATKGQWAKDEAPLGAAAEDEQLGRARQRIAELERELDLSQPPLNLTNLKDLEYLMEVAAAHLTAQSPFNDKWMVRARRYQEAFQKRIKELGK